MIVIYFLENRFIALIIANTSETIRNKCIIEKLSPIIKALYIGAKAISPKTIGIQTVAL